MVEGEREPGAMMKTYDERQMLRLRWQRPQEFLYRVVKRSFLFL